MQEEIKKENSGGLRMMSDVFSSHSNVYEEHFKKSTVGLQSFEDFKRKRKLVKTMMEEEERKKEQAAKRARKRKKKERKKNMTSLSFFGEEEVNESMFEPKKSKKKKKKKVKKKDPTVETHFLADKEREDEEKRLRSELESKWKAQQDAIKNEIIQVTYSYWDGTGHRHTIKVKKGTRIEQFLEKARKDIMEAFHELRGISCENLMYIKEDLIIPHHYSFYDLIVTKARGKSGPLFHFDVHDDVRLVGNASIEKDESHAGKIVTRAYYERNQHIFPVNRWEVYDPAKKFDKYTIK